MSNLDPVIEVLKSEISRLNSVWASSQGRWADDRAQLFGRNIVVQREILMKSYIDSVESLRDLEEQIKDLG